MPDALPHDAICWNAFELSSAPGAKFRHSSFISLAPHDAHGDWHIDATEKEKGSLSTRQPAHLRPGPLQMWDG